MLKTEEHILCFRNEKGKRKKEIQLHLFPDYKMLYRQIIFRDEYVSSMTYGSHVIEFS